MAEPKLREKLREHVALACVGLERIEQDGKWGIQNHNDLKWLAILTEEVGEAAEMVNEDTPTAGLREYEHKAIEENLEYELVQIAAVCVAWIEAIRRRPESEGQNEHR